MKKIEKAFLAVLMIHKYMQRYPLGHSLHIILSDKNYSKSSALFCYNYAKENNDLEGMAIAFLLSKFGEKAQQKICERPNEVFSDYFNYIEKC